MYTFDNCHPMKTESMTVTTERLLMPTCPGNH